MQPGVRRRRGRNPGARTRGDTCAWHEGCNSKTYSWHGLGLDGLHDCFCLSLLVEWCGTETVGCAKQANDLSNKAPTTSAMDNGDRATTIPMAATNDEVDEHDSDRDEGHSTKRKYKPCAGESKLRLRVCSAVFGAE